MTPDALAPRRPGRPPEAERGRRREGALDAALAELAHRGYEAVTMAAVARRAGSSKESLYAWYGSKENLVAEVIRRQAAATNARVETALRTDRPDDLDAPAVLRGIASELLRLLVGPESLALNRAAMSSPALAAVLLAHGRHTTGPIVERYLARLVADGRLAAADPAELFRLLYGLVVQDTQIRALLGEPPPGPADQARQAAAAVGRFLELAGRPERTSATG